jgi:nitrite reductase/ring-hydroxylating ferredoxin subunit
LSGTYQTVARVGQIPEGEGRPFEVDGRAIALILDGGVSYAIDDTCPLQCAQK